MNGVPDRVDARARSALVDVRFARLASEAADACAREHVALVHAGGVILARIARALVKVDTLRDDVTFSCIRICKERQENMKYFIGNQLSGTTQYRSVMRPLIY